MGGGCVRGFKIKMTVKAQSTVEFVFAMIIVLFLGFGLVKVMSWAGLDLAERRIAQDNSLFSGTSPDQQLSTTEFYRPKHMDAMYKGKIGQ